MANDNQDRLLDSVELPNRIVSDGIYAKRRRHPRYQTRLLIKDKAGINVFESSGNVSAGGFCFANRGQETFRVGRVVNLLYCIPGTSFWIAARGIVLGTNPAMNPTGIRGVFIQKKVENVGLVRSWMDSAERRS